MYTHYDMPHTTRRDLPMVYFIQCNNGPIKVGWTEKPPEYRLTNLQSCNPYELTLLGVIPKASLDVEAQLHRYFDHLRIRREWFRPEPFLLDYIHTHALPYVPDPPAHSRRTGKGYRQPASGKWLRLALDVSGLSQNQAVKRLGITPSTLAHWCNGQPLLTIGEIHWIADRLGLDPRLVAPEWFV